MNYEDPIFLHTAGAIVKPKHPFSDLTVYRNDIPIIDHEFISKWVSPFYRGLPHGILGISDSVSKIKGDISKEIVRKLLSDFNWRTRQTGALFAFLMNYEEFMENIANLLLQSEVCFAGKTYAVVLAAYDKEFSKKYFIRYLDYYLTTPEYYFDQDFVLAGLFAISEISEEHAEIQNKYNSFIKAQGRKKNIKEEIEHFNICLSSMTDIRKKLSI